jgi:hypothetical protein
MYSNTDTDNDAQTTSSDTFETSCQDCSNSNSNNSNNCDCGFDEDLSSLPTNPQLAQSYVPFQYIGRTFMPEVGLRMGTIYPELVSPYFPGQSMEEIAYLSGRNEIGEGCNTCQ